jgi:hypothetical protein
MLHEVDSFKGRRVIFSQDDETSEITMFKLPFDDGLTEEEIQDMIDDFEEDYTEVIQEMMGRRFSVTTYDPEAEELFKLN